MRKFFIENELGVRYALNNETGIFLSAPSGLGVTLNPSFADLKKGFFRAVSGDTEPQSTIACSLVFTGNNAYATYREFANWCNITAKLFLVYLPYGTNEYYRGIALNYMTKTELTETRWLEVPVSLACITPWYRATPSRMSMVEESGYVMRYSFSYTTELVYSSSNAGSMAVDIAAGGHIPAALVFSYTGEIINPRLTLRGTATDAVYGLCSLNVTLAANEKLEISTLYGDSYARMIGADGVTTDLLNAVDLSYEPFPRVPITEDCTLFLAADEVINGTATVRVYYYYRSV